jgi:cell division protein FtsZ
MGDEVRVTVIAAGFDRWDDSRAGVEEAPARSSLGLSASEERFSEEDLELDDDDDFDVPSFLK